MTEQSARPGIMVPLLDLGLVFRRCGLFCFLVAMFVSPRIILPIVIPGRQFDIRVEDLILLLCLLSWAVALAARPCLFLSPLITPIGVYAALMTFGTGIAIMALGLSPVRGGLFLGKELEYFTIFLLVANWVRTPADLRFAGWMLLIGGLLNAAWAGVQVATGIRVQLFHVLGSPVEPGSRLAVGLFSARGPALIGETSPLSAGGFFLLIFLLAFSYLLASRTLWEKRVYLVISGMLLVCLVFTTSRMSIVAGILGLAVLAPVSRKKLAAVLAIGTLMSAIALALSQAYVRYEETTGASVLGMGGPVGRFSLAEVERDLVEREAIWQSLLPDTLNIIGFGQGALGFLPGLDNKEAHNYYLRVFMESGIFGVIAFVWLLVSIGRLSVRVSNKSRIGVVRAVSGATLAATVGLSVGALVQDVFTPVTLNEVWWVLVGLTAAAYRIEHRAGRSPEQEHGWVPPGLAAAEASG